MIIIVALFRFRDHARSFSFLRFCFALSYFHATSTHTHSLTHKTNYFTYFPTKLSCFNCLSLFNCLNIYVRLFVWYMTRVQSHLFNTIVFRLFTSHPHKHLPNFISRSLVMPFDFVHMPHIQLQCFVCFV